MKLLLDQNISYKLVRELGMLYPNSNHIYLLGLHNASDHEIWNYALNNNFVIVTQDSDFSERSILLGYPPKVIWLRTGNVSTDNIKNLLTDRYQDIVSFEKDKNSGSLEIY